MPGRKPATKEKRKPKAQVKVKREPQKDVTLNERGTVVNQKEDVN